MRNVFFIALFGLLLTNTTNSQSVNGFGFKAGLNYNANGNYFESISSNAEHPDRNVGYHFGLFSKFGNQLYFKPEVVYTSTKSDYDNNTFKMQKLDIPLLVGIKVLGPLSVYGGPAFQFILDSEFDNISINNIEKDLTFGLNFGIGLNMKKIGLDLRYERGLNNNEASFLNNNGINTSRIDTRPNQLILSLSFIL
ncbi:outer membrane beta-barrel protein [Seonamhaeicola maritimus]|uniref:PorT family protein n=1 Tax=Seonamhaeicola maritimus TaxID=2591822 RepID=A0A5C7GDR7_9FLAO|nr:outer membrane beta-barrel protein [Seonamhaeicola maritimus]TXG34831.1 PorT family protein [Seonamhaeicola maritimus]